VWRGVSSTHFAGPGGHYAFYRSDDSVASTAAPDTFTNLTAPTDWFKQRISDKDPPDTPYVWQEKELKERLPRLNTWEGYTRQCIYIGCFPLRHIDHTKEHDFRLPGFIDAAQHAFHVLESTSLPSAPNASVAPRGYLTAHQGATVWSPHRDSRTLPMLYYVPWAEFTIDFWRFHKLKRDCSHFCYSPLMYTPLWSELVAVWEAASRKPSQT
jgi:hypothetical protein